MSMIPNKPKVYDDGRTKQAFKDQCDVNKLLQKAQRTGSLSHLQKWSGFYGEFAEYDYLDHQIKLARGAEIFNELPANVKKEFNNNPGAFFDFVNNPDNADRLNDLLPELAKPGRQFPDVTGKKAETPGPAQPVAKPKAPENGAPAASQAASEASE